MVWNQEQFGRGTEIVIRIREEPRVDVPMGANERQVDNRLMKFGSQFALSRKGTEVTIAGE